MKRFFLFLLVWQSFFSKAQTLPFNNKGINGGLSFNLGTTVDRVGVYFGGFYYYDFFQINSTVRIYYNFKTFGPSIRGFEFQPSIGLLCAFGEKRKQRDEFFDVTANQTFRRYSLGYALNFYFDRMKTSQRTGVITLGFDRFKLITENDILATPRSDRFRTGAVKLIYQYQQSLLGLSILTWTGNPQSPATIKIKDSDYPSRFGYLDISNAPYGKYAHGILALQLKHTFGYGQETQVSTGIDAEGVRNIIQNKLIHDMYFWPKKWNKARNPHIPMLDSEGKPYLYKKNQKIKPSTFYLDLSLNPSLFY